MDARGRILAVDYGEKNIGLAYCDELGLTVQPMPSLPNCGTANLLKNLRTIIAHSRYSGNSTGNSIQNGRNTGRCRAAYGAAAWRTLKAALKIPISGVDERLSTVEAMEFWRGMNKKQQKKYRTVDSLAAAFILERHLKEN